MRVKDIERAYDYHYWATHHVIGAASRLTLEEFTRVVAGSYGSVRNTLVHILSAEWGWLDRCGGPARGQRLIPQDFPTTQVLIEAWTRVEGYMRGFLSGLTDDDMARVVEFTLGGTTQALPLGDLLQHAAVHAAHHRGQVALLLRALGHVPGNFDWLVYVGNRGQVPV